MRMHWMLLVLVVVAGCAWPSREDRWREQVRQIQVRTQVLENQRRARELEPLGKVWVTFSSWCHEAVTVWVVAPSGVCQRVCVLQPKEQRNAELNTSELELLACLDLKGRLVNYDCDRQHTGDYLVIVSD